MTELRTSVRSLVLALAAIGLLCLSLGQVMGDETTRTPAAKESQETPEGVQEASEQGTEVAEPAEGGCEPDLSAPELTSLLALSPAEEEVCPADPLESLFPVAMGPPNLRRYCKCGCGLGCQTSDDCGGAACVSYISCC